MNGSLRACSLAVFALLACGHVVASGVPFWGARESSPADAPVSALKPGQYIWIGEALRDGPLLVVVSLDEQRAYVYRNGVLIGATTVSTGRPGHETPTGVFTVLQKDKDHRSTIYDSAPMPYMERLTWGGVALHAGGLPGYPESHGCVHLPSEFARRLFEISTAGMTVVVAGHASAPSDIVHPGYLVPVDYVHGAVVRTVPLSQSESFRWQPQLAADGPVSIVVSRISGRIVVYRNGVEIGRARVIFRGSDPVGTHMLTLVQGASPIGTARFVPDPAHLHWTHIGIAGHAEESGTELDAGLAARLEIPQPFVASVLPILKSGATILVTDAAITPTTSGPKLDIINADPPAVEHR